MKTFSGNRPIDEAICRMAKLGFKADHSRLVAGSDYIDFYGFAGSVAYNTFNGKFTVFDYNGEKVADECSSDLDDVPWYSAILEALYFPGVSA